jgi:hypothetical protein
VHRVLLTGVRRPLVSMKEGVQTLPSPVRRSEYPGRSHLQDHYTGYYIKANTFYSQFDVALHIAVMFLKGCEKGFMTHQPTS